MAYLSTKQRRSRARRRAAQGAPRIVKTNGLMRTNQTPERIAGSMRYFARLNATLGLGWRPPPPPNPIRWDYQHGRSRL